MSFERTEGQRVDAVLDLGVMDDPSSQEAYDRIARLARMTFGTDIVTIGFMDNARLWLKSRVGTSIRELASSSTFSLQTITAQDTVVVEDARSDPRFQDLPVVVGEPFIRFYAGAPLLTHDGHALGVFSILDPKPRTFGKDDVSALKEFAALVMSQVKLDREIGRLDPLTRLPNRLKLLLDLQGIARREPGARRLMILVDLMSVRHLDETIGALGIDFFNEQVRQAAAILRRRMGDMPVYHLGNAYLGLIMPDEERDVALRIDAAISELREQITTATGIPFTLRPCVGIRRIGLDGLMYGCPR